MKFSVVIPVKDEEHFLRRNLPSWCALKPDELILCFDDPAPQSCVQIAREIAESHDVELNILEVKPNPEYRFHQAWVRRKGFLEARNDVILTGDIDLQVYPSCLEAVRLVGKGNAGLASCLKTPRINNMKDLYIRICTSISRSLVGMYCFLRGKPSPPPHFTGLYAFLRKAWMETEDEGIKKMPNPKKKRVPSKVTDPYADVYPIGEDTYLRDCMLRRYHVIYLPCIGARSLDREVEQHPDVQYLLGYYHALADTHLRRPFRLALIHTITYWEPHFLRGYLRCRRERIMRLKPDLRSHWAVCKGYLDNLYPYPGRYPSRYRGVLELIRRHNVGGETVLEVGCLDGYGLNVMAEAGFEVLGVEIYSEALRRPKRETNSIVKASAESLPFKDKSFDILVSADVLEHVHRSMTEKVLLEMDRVAHTNIHRIHVKEQPDAWVGGWHINVKPLTWWQRLLAERGMKNWIVYRGDTP